MRLTNLAIRNYRGLEDVRLDGFGQINTVIGQNNSGKSSVFGALSVVVAGLVGGLDVNFDGRRILTDQQLNRQFEMDLTFDTDSGERHLFIERLYSNPDLAERKIIVTASPFARQLSFAITSLPGIPSTVYIREVRMLTEDSKWTKVIQGDLETRDANRVRFVSANYPGWVGSSGLLDHVGAGMNTQGGTENETLSRQLSFTSPSEVHPIVRWPLVQFEWFLRRCFFFSPIRQSNEEMPVQWTSRLLPDGRNLVEVLTMMRLGQGPTFEAIGRFLDAALPGVGILHTPPVQTSNTTFIGFQPEGSVDNYRLKDLGSGVEQLLMTAAVLHTTDSRHALFLEEPEGHLHPGAQRFLLEHLYADGRQILLTTHSPTFLNLDRPKAIFRVTRTGRRTSIESLGSQDSLMPVLADIGVQRSDVLMANAVLLVEGRSDQLVFRGLG